MTPEERERSEKIDRRLEFLAEQTARNFEQIAENSRQIAENSRQIAENSRQIAEHSDQIAQLGSSFSELQGLVLRLGRVVEEQARVQSRTDDRLNALIAVVERYFSNGRN
jgi:methyl-accepting chemotaxis protein